MMWVMTMLKVDPIWQADVQQQNYRALLQAMSRPGTLQPLVGIDQQGHAAAKAVLAALVDGEVTLSDPLGMIDADDWPLLQARSSAPASADYILFAGNALPDFEPRLGSLPCPEQSATFVLVVDSLQAGELTLELAGPGVNGRLSFSPKGLSEAWVERREDWVCAFPLGVDLILVDDTRMAAIPRTTKLKVL